MNKTKDKKYLIDNAKLMAEWDWEKNNAIGLDPRMITQGSDKKIYWKGCCGHKWDDSVSHRVSGRGCPVCSHKRIGPSPNYENSIWASRYREYASNYLTEAQMKSYMPGSMTKIAMTCPHCGTVKYDNPNHLCYRGFACTKCSDGISFSNKFMQSFLDQLHIDFIPEYSSEWSGYFRYDFYLPKYNCIIENHGRQHYLTNGFSSCGGRTLEEEQVNDKCKKDLAIDNQISYYFELDCRYSELNWIKNSVVNSGLLQLLNVEEAYIDWTKCLDNAKSSLVMVAAQEWNNGLQLKQITQKIKKSWQATVGYLRKASELGLCNYSHEESVKRAAANHVGGAPSVPVYCIELNMVFFGAKEAGKVLNIKTHSHILEACSGRVITAGGLRWKYLYNRNKRNGAIIPGAITLGLITEEEALKQLEEQKNIEGEN